MPCTLSNNEQNLYCIFHVWQGEKNHWSILLPITKSLGIIFKIVIHATRNNLPNQPTMHMHQLTLLAFHAHASNENKFDACVHTTRINLHFNWTFIFPVRTLGLRHINQQRWSSWKNGSVERRENKKKPSILSSAIGKTAEIGPQMRKTERMRRAWLLHQNATHPSDELSPSASRGQSRGLQEIDGAERRSASSSFASLSPTPSFLLPFPPPNLSRRRVRRESKEKWCTVVAPIFFVSPVNIVYESIYLQLYAKRYCNFSYHLNNLKNSIILAKKSLCKKIFIKI